MKLLKIFLMAICLQVIGACSDKQNTPSESPTAATLNSGAASVKTYAPSKPEHTIPANISGMPFELGGKCTVDSINDQGQVELSTVVRSNALVIVGWAFDDKSATVPDAPVLQLVNGDQRFYAPLNRRGHRDDLSKAFGNQQFNQAGFDATIDISNLPIAQYDVLIMQNAPDKILVCPTYRKLAIKD